MAVKGSKKYAASGSVSIESSRALVMASSVELKLSFISTPKFFDRVLTVSSHHLIISDADQLLLQHLSALIWTIRNLMIRTCFRTLREGLLNRFELERH